MAPSESRLPRLAWALIFVLTLLPAPPAAAEGVLVSGEISGPLGAEGTVRQWDVSPDGRYAVFIADPAGREQAELYSVPLAGGERVRLKGTTMHDQDVRSFQISPDSRYVVLAVGVYEAPVWRTVRLYSVPIEGGDEVQISSPPPAATEHTITSYAISPDSQRVAYVSDHDSAGVGSLYSVPIGGGASVLLAGFETMCSPCGIRYTFTPNGLRVLFERTVSPSSTTLAVVPAAGGAEIVLNADSSVHAEATPNSLGAVYCRRTAPDTYGLYAVAFADPAHPEALSPSSTSAIQFLVSPTSARTVYRMFDAMTSTGTLYSVPTTGGPSDVLSGPLAAGVDVGQFAVTPNGQAALFTSNRNADGHWDLYGAPIAGGVAVRLNQALGVGGGVDWFQVLPSNAGVVYMASEGTGSRRELYGLWPWTGSPVRLNAPLAPDGNVYSFAISPNSDAAVYAASQAADGVIEAYVYYAGGHVLRIGPLFPIMPGMMLGPQSRLFEITPDSRGVVYPADPTGSGHWRLYLAQEIAYRAYTPMVLR